MRAFTSVVRRKGEQKIPKIVREYTPDHPVARMIASGDCWVNAWVVQMTTPWAIIAKRTGINEKRLREFEGGAEPSPIEIETLAVLWYVTPQGLTESIRNDQRRERAHSDQ